MGVEEDLLSIFQGNHVALKNNIDVKPEPESMSFIPKTKANMCYICGAVIFDEKGNVLLIQEAKKSCLGTWYLPAGRLEPGETIIDGVKREVKEEAGFDCDLTTLLSVEINSFTWIRFIFLGKITGGKLKTLEEKDAESLQAKFFSKEDIQLSKSSLRHNDILKLIDLGRKYQELDPLLRCPNILPVISPHDRLVHRVVIIDRSFASAGTIHMLINTVNENHIPAALLNHSKQFSFAVSVFALLKDAFSKNPNSTSVRMCGIFGVEHRGTGQQEDGLCLTSLVSLDLSADVQPPPVTSNTYQWYPIKNKSIANRLEDGAKGKTVPLL